MSDIGIQTIFDVRLYSIDPAVFQPFCCVSLVEGVNTAAAVWGVNTAAAVIVKTQAQFRFNIINTAILE